MESYNIVTIYFPNGKRKDINRYKRQVNSMKPNEIKGARTRLGLTQEHMATELEISVSSYQKKEGGIVKFSDEEKVKVAKILELSPKQMNDYLYNGMLPIGNVSVGNW